MITNYVPGFVLDAGNIVVIKTNICLLGEKGNKQIEIYIYLYIVVSCKKKMTILGEKNTRMDWL